MNLFRHIRIIFSDLRTRMVRAVLRHRLRYRYPTLACDPTAIMDYGFADVDAIQCGQHVHVGAFAEVVVYKRVRYSAIEGRLILGDRVVISAGCNIRAAGGTIAIGEHTAISQNCVLVAANHNVRRGLRYISMPWDELRCGITIGRNVWVGAQCTILPGVVIGDNAVIAGGSVVNTTVPPDEIWGGVPARKLKDVPD